MWCKNCNIETNDDKCPICGETTVEDIPAEVYWCQECETPIIQTVNQLDKGICPMCGKKTKYMAADLRPVFPEERLLQFAPSDGRCCVSQRLPGAGKRLVSL